jgi:hypothetical protein
MIYLINVILFLFNTELYEMMMAYYLRMIKGGKVGRFDEHP